MRKELFDLKMRKKHENVKYKIKSDKKTQRNMKLIERR